MTDRLPPHWLDVSTDAPLRKRLSAQLRRECGPKHVLATRGLTCSAKCEGCDSALVALDDDEWAVVHLTWGGAQSDPQLPWVEALGAWEDVLPVLNAHSSGMH
ncbi:MAG: hypothetical protein ABWY51_08085 [Gaiellaceae bacterium]